MGLQKYRFDRGVQDDNGQIILYAEWMGGPSLAGIRDAETPWGRRTVYITGEADTFFSVPAACKVRGKTRRGFVTCEDGQYRFNANTQELERP